jgi:hypothetical protein
MLLKVNLPGRIHLIPFMLIAIVEPIYRRSRARLSFSFISVALMHLLFLPAPGFSIESVKDAEPGWKFISKSSDYSLYEKPSEGSSGLFAFRLVGELNYSAEEVAIAILDREHRMSWMRDVRELKTVRFPKPGAVIEYTAIKTPIVIRDRDFLIQTEVEVDRLKQKFVITSHSVTDPQFPVGSDVRGEMTNGRFVIEPGAHPGTSRLIAEMDVDPKGSVPRWIVNKFQKRWPVGMFRGLQRFLKTKTATLPEDLKLFFLQNDLKKGL